MVNRRIFILGLLVILVWQGIRTFRVASRFGPVVASPSVPAFRPSPYSQLSGYRLESETWFQDSLRTCSDSHCHRIASAQHAMSAHGRALTNDAFRTQLAGFIREKGRAAADYCLACHAPLGVIAHPAAGASPAQQVDPITTTSPAFTIGVGCVVCHRARPERARERIGNASLRIEPLWMDPDHYIGEGNVSGDALQRRLIELRPELHRKTYHIDAKEADAICGACHVVPLPASLAPDAKTSMVADHYLSFLDSPFAKAGLSCASCHQQAFLTYRDGYKMVDHSYLGSGSSLPYAEAELDSQFRALSMGFLAGLGNLDVQAKTAAALPPSLESMGLEGSAPEQRIQRGWENPLQGTNGGVAQRDLLRVEVQAVRRGGDAVQARVVTTNTHIGHTFPSGGGIKSYLEVRVLDAHGLVLATYGGLGPDGQPVATPSLLGVRTVDIEGRPVINRRFWAAAKTAYRRDIAPAAAVVDDVRLAVAEPRAAVAIEATWYYLRPERFRNRERGIAREISPVAIGHGRWTAAAVSASRHAEAAP